MFLGLTYETLGVLWLGALLGGMAAGGSGFAFALAASSIWLHRIDPLHVAIMSTGCGVVLHLSTIWPQRHHIKWGRLWPFVAGGLAGVPIGVYFLTYTDAGILKISLGVFLILFGIYAFIVPQLAGITAGGRLADAVVGFVGGILGGIGGYSGVLPTIWTQLRGWPKPTARGVYQPYVIIIQGVTLAGIVGMTLDRTGLLWLLAVLPPMLLGAWIGWKIYGKLNERRFRQLLAVLLIGSGVTLVF